MALTEYNTKECVPCESAFVEIIIETQWVVCSGDGVKRLEARSDMETAAGRNGTISFETWNDIDAITLRNCWSGDEFELVYNNKYYKEAICIFICNSNSQLLPNTTYDESDITHKMNNGLLKLTFTNVK